jgi:fatty acid-binding protein DegV
MTNGEAKVAAKIRVDADWILVIADWFEAQFGAGRPVYAAVNHGSVRSDAAVLMRELEKRLDVRTRMVRPISPAVYLHTGPGALGAYVAPLDELPFEAPSLGDVS